MGNTVFISYSSKDLEIVNRIIEELDLMGVNYWKAPEMIPAGSSYAREIPKAIQQCGVFLLVLSKHSQDSIWVEKEIDSAICNRKIIIPFQIEEVFLSDTFRFYLNNVQMVAYYQDEKGAFSLLKRQLKQVIPEPSVGDSSENAVEISVKPSVKPSEVTSSVVVRSGQQSEEKNRSREEGDPRDRILSIESAGNNRHNRRGGTNAFRMNRIPLACQYCGCKELENVTMGTYRCVRCNRDNYDDFQTIRNFLEKTGAASAIVIERETGVPRRIIEYFFKDEYLEIPKNSLVRVPCERCGAPIRTGTLCDMCKASPKIGIKNDRRGTWHSIW